MASSFPIEPKQKVDFELTEFEGWEFYISKLPMFNTKELDQISDVIPTQTLPDILFGYNRMYFVNKKRNFLYEFSPIDSLSLSAFALQQTRLHPDERKESTEENKEIDQKEESKEEKIAIWEDSDFTKLNYIDLRPERVEVRQAEKWKDRDVSKIDDYKEIEIISDWTYSTPYKGTIHYLDKNLERIKNEFGLEIKPNDELDNNNIVVERTEDEIPVDRLTPTNKIIHYFEIELFEDELDDCGQTSSKVRFRIMKDWFYALVRYYLRVDGVIVRILDTRIFHDFSTNCIIREFWYKEASYAELKAKHFDLSSEWALDINQADRIFNSLTLKQKFRDKVTF